MRDANNHTVGHFLIAAPISIVVTPSARPLKPANYPNGNPDAAVTIPFALIPALLDHLHRVACEASRGAHASDPRNLAWMEDETGREGWRALLGQDTAHLIHVLEDAGIAEFSPNDDQNSGSNGS